MSQGSDERDVWIFRVHDQPPNGMRVAKPNKLPGFSRVDGFVHTVSADDVAANAGFPSADIDRVGIGFGNGERTDRRRGGLLLVKDGFPIEAAIRGLPDAARNAAKIVSVVLANHARDSENPSAAKGPD